MQPCGDGFDRQRRLPRREGLLRSFQFELVLQGIRIRPQTLEPDG